MDVIRSHYSNEVNESDHGKNISLELEVIILMK